MRKDILWGLVGAVVGFAVGYAIGKKKSQKKEEVAEEKPELPEKEEEKADPMAQMEGLRAPYSAATIDYSAILVNDMKSKLERQEVKKEIEESKNEPYTISPTEFTENDDYEEVSLTYYSDGVVSDDFEHVLTIPEIRQHIGDDALNKFGEYEDDCVYVQNDGERKLYEIVRDSRLSTDVLAPTGMLGDDDY